MLSQEEDGFGLFGSSPLLEGLTSRKTSFNADYNSEPETDSSLTNGSTDFKVDNSVAKASLIDDSYWRSIDINSEHGTVCSYQLLNSDTDTTNNVFEVQLSGMKNAEIGLYYG